MIRNLAMATALLITAGLIACGGYTPNSSLSMSESASSIAAFGTSQLHIVYSIQDGTTTDVTRTAEITIKDPSVATVNANGLVTGSGFGGTTTITASYQGQTATTSLTVMPAQTIVGWGDGFTYGVGATASSFSYPSQLQSQLQRPTVNAGIPSQTSTQVAARQGGVPIHITLQDNESPATGEAFASSVDVKFLSTTSDTATRTSVGSLGTVPGTVTRTATVASGSSTVTEIYSFAQDANGSDQTIPADSVFSIDSVQMPRSEVNIFWVGRSNFASQSQVLSDVAAMVAFQTSGQFIVIGVLNGEGEGTGTTNYNEITSLDSALKSAYPNNFLDVREVLVADYDPTSAQDVKDHTNDIPPTSLRFDSINLGDNGFAIVAKTIGAKITAEGW